MSDGNKTLPEWSLSFTDERSITYWTPIHANTSAMAKAEGEARAIALLTLKIDEKDPGNRAMKFGQVCGNIARDQSVWRRKGEVLDREQRFYEACAIDAFWSLIGELAIFHMPQDAPKYAAACICRRLDRYLAEHAALQSYRESAAREKRQRMVARRRRTVRRQKTAA
jgi:hypothetical protein